MTTEPATYGLVLAGGLARRMGGGDKGLIRIGGATILERALARVGPQCAGLIINANGDPARFARFGLPVVADDVEGFAGPLAGILAGLDWLAANEPAIGWLASVPGDCPFLPRDLVRRLNAARTAARVPLACANRVRRVFFELCAVGALEAANIASEFDRGDLHPKTKTEVRHSFFPGVFARCDFSFDTSIPESSWYDDPGHRSEGLCGIGSFQNFRVDPDNFDSAIIGRAGVSE